MTTSSDRFRIRLVALYALLSLFFSRSETLTFLESTAINFYRPWDALRGDGEPLPAPPPAPGQAGWWRPVWDTPGLGNEHAVLGARACSRITGDQSRVLYHTTDAFPVEPGDPVVLGSALVGFVIESRPPDRVLVALLTDREAPLVPGEVKGTVAGEEIGFAAGGRVPEAKGLIRLRIPSARLGLASGSRAFSTTHPLTPKVPAGFYLGRVTLGEADQPLDEAALVPAHAPQALHRVGILVPFHRLENAVSAAVIPELSFAEAEVSASLVGNGFRVYAGKEKGLAPGDLLVQGRYALARLEQVGLFASSASLLASTGEEIEVASMTLDGDLRRFRITLLHRFGTVFEARAADEPAGLQTGQALYMSGYPCSGLETHPAFLVLDPGEEQRLTLTVPWPAPGEGRCLHLESAP